MESAHSNKNGTTASLPSPPSSLKAGGSSSAHNENDLLSPEVAGGGISANKSFVDAYGGASAGKRTESLFRACRLIIKIANAVTGERSRAQPSDDVRKNGENLQGKDKSSQKKHNTGSRDVDSDEYVSGLTEEIIDNAIAGGRPLRERIKKAPKRVLQQMAYTQFMEDRINDLEKRLLEIENREIRPVPSATRPEKKNKPADPILGLKRMNFQEYLPTDPNTGNKTRENVFIEHKQRHEFRQAAYHLIDVVVSATPQPERLGKGQSTKPPAGALGPTTPSLASSPQDPTISDGQFVQPERICINSGLLLNAVEVITDVTFTKSHHNGERQLLSQVILRPFKLLVLYEREIRDEVIRLEKKHMPDHNESRGGAPEMTQSKGRGPLPQPTTDILNTIPESLTLDHSNDLMDEDSQNS